MSRVFSWEYFSFLQIDDSIMSKLLVAVPVLLLLLGAVWLQLVQG